MTPKVFLYNYMTHNACTTHEHVTIKRIVVTVTRARYNNCQRSLRSHNEPVWADIGHMILYLYTSKCSCQFLCFISYSWYWCQFVNWCGICLKIFFCHQVPYRALRKGATRKKIKTKSCNDTFCYSCKPCGVRVFLCLTLSLIESKPVGFNFVPSGRLLTPLKFLFYCCC